MQHRSLIALGLLILIGQWQDALAQSAAISGAGALECADYVKAAAANDPAAGGYLAWAQGLMSALNLTRDAEHRKTRILLDKAHPVERQAAFLLQFCQASPKEKFSVAALRLYRALPPVP
jgi:hypothetical protein